MLEARIISPRGSLYIAAEATSYDVQELRSHVRSLYGPTASAVQLSLRLGPQAHARVRDLVTALAAELAGEGVRVTVDDAPIPPRDAPGERFPAAAMRRPRRVRGRVA